MAESSEVVRYSNLIVTFERVWERSLDVVWNKELYDGFEITKLHVHVVAPQLKVERYFSPSDSRLSLTNLSPGCRVIASIRAQHSDGQWGNWCRAECLTVLPATLRIRKLGRSFLAGAVHWSPAVDLTNDGKTSASSPALSHFEVMLIPGARGVPRLLRVPASHAPSFHFGNLPPSCAFALRARAVPAKGEAGTFGPVTVFRTVPSLTLGVCDLSGTSATITWQRALDNSGAAPGDGSASPHAVMAAGVSAGNADGGDGAVKGADRDAYLDANEGGSAVASTTPHPEEADTVAELTAAEPLPPTVGTLLSLPTSRAHALRWIRVRVYALPDVQRGEDYAPESVVDMTLGDEEAAAVALDPETDPRTLCADVAEAAVAGSVKTVTETEVQVGGLEGGREYEAVCTYQTVAGGGVQETRVRLTTVSGAGLVDVTMVTSDTVDIAWRHPSADVETGALVKGGDHVTSSRVGEWQLVVFRGVSIDEGEVLLTTTFPFSTTSTRVQALHPATEYAFCVRPRTTEGVWGPYSPPRWVTTRPPLKCRALGVGETWLLLGWRSAPPQRPVGAPVEELITDGVEKWHVQLTEVRGLYRESKYLDGAADTYRAVGLQPGRTYSATVQAYWQGEWQSWSTPVELSTHAPPSVWAACRTEESVTVEWRSAYAEDSLNAGARSASKVRLVVSARGAARGGAGAAETVLVDEEHDVRGSRRVGGLTAGQSVTVVVSDFDAHVGLWNAPSRPVTLRTLSQVLEVASLSSTSVTLSWVRDAEVFDMIEPSGPDTAGAAASSSSRAFPRIGATDRPNMTEGDADAQLRATLSNQLSKVSAGAGRWAESGSPTNAQGKGLTRPPGPAPPVKPTVMKTCLKVVTAEGISVGAFHFTREDPTLYTVHGLKAGSNYVARLATLDDAGVWSPWSAAVRFMTAPRLAVDVVDVGPTFAAIHWKLSVPVPQEDVRLYEAGLTGPVTILYDEILEAGTGAPISNSTAETLGSDLHAMRSLLTNEAEGKPATVVVAGMSLRRGARVSFVSDASAGQHVAWGLESNSAYVITIAPGRGESDASKGWVSSEPACVMTLAPDAEMQEVKEDVWKSAALLRVNEVQKDHIKLSWKGKESEEVEDWLLQVEAHGGDPDVTATVVGKGVTDYLLRGLSLATVYSVAVVPARRGAAESAAVVTGEHLESIQTDDAMWLAVASLPANCVARSPTWLHVGWEVPREIAVTQRFVYVTLMGNGAAHTQAVRHAGDVDSHVFAGLRPSTDYRVHVLVVAVCVDRAAAEQLVAAAAPATDRELDTLPASYWSFDATFGLTNATTGALAARSLAVSTLSTMSLSTVAVADSFAVVDVDGHGAPAAGGYEIAAVPVPPGMLAPGEGKDAALQSDAEREASESLFSGAGVLRWRCAAPGKVLLNGLEGGRPYRIGVRILSGVPALDDVAEWQSHAQVQIQVPPTPGAVLGGGQAVNVQGVGEVAVGAGESHVVAAWPVNESTMSTAADAAPPRWEVWLTKRTSRPPADIPAAIVAAATSGEASPLLVEDAWASVCSPVIEMGGLDPQTRYWVYVRTVRTMVIADGRPPVEIHGEWGEGVKFHTQAPLRAALRGVADNHAVVGWVRVPVTPEGSAVDSEDAAAANAAAAAAAESGLPFSCTVKVYGLPRPRTGEGAALVSHPLTLPVGGCAWRIGDVRLKEARGIGASAASRALAGGLQGSFDWRSVGLRGEPDFAEGVVWPYGGGSAEQLRLVFETTTLPGEGAVTVPDLHPGETYIAHVVGEDQHSVMRPCPPVLFTTVPAMRLSIATVADTFAVVQWSRTPAVVAAAPESGARVSLTANAPQGASRDMMFLADAFSAATTVEVGVTPAPSRMHDPTASDGRGPLCADSGVEKTVTVSVDPIADAQAVGGSLSAQEVPVPKGDGEEYREVGYRIGGLPAGCPLLLRVRSKLPLSEAWGVWSNTVAAVTLPAAAARVKVIGDTFAGLDVEKDQPRHPASAAELCAGLFVPRADAVADAIAGLLFEAANAVGALDPPENPPAGFEPGSEVFSRVAASSAAWLAADTLVPEDTDVTVAAITAFIEELRASADGTGSPTMPHMMESPEAVDSAASAQSALAASVNEVAPASMAELLGSVAGGDGEGTAAGAGGSAAPTAPRASAGDAPRSPVGGPTYDGGHQRGIAVEQAQIFRRDEAYATALLRHCTLVQEAVLRVAHLNSVAKSLSTSRAPPPTEAAVVAWDIALVRVDRLRGELPDGTFGIPNPAAVKAGRTSGSRPTTAPVQRSTPRVEFRAVVRVGGGSMRVEGLAPRAPLAVVCRPLFVANFPERVVEPALLGGMQLVPRGALTDAFAGLPDGANPFGTPPRDAVEPVLASDENFPIDELSEGDLPLPLAWGAWGKETPFVTLAKAELRVVGVGGDFVVLDWLSSLPDATVEGVMRSVERFALRAFNRTAAAPGVDGVHSAAQTFWVQGSSIRSGPGESRAVLVPGLVPDSTYVLYLCAQFQDGSYGDWSSPVIVHTDLQVLCALRNVAETAASLVVMRPGGAAAATAREKDGILTTVDVPAPFGDFDATREHIDDEEGVPEESVHALAVVSLDDLAGSLPSGCAAQPNNSATAHDADALWSGTFDIVSAKGRKDVAEALILPRGELPADGSKLPPLRRPAPSKENSPDKASLSVTGGSVRFEVSLARGLVVDLMDLPGNSAVTLWLRHPAPAHVSTEQAGGPTGAQTKQVAQSAAASAAPVAWLPWHAVSTFETVCAPPGKPAVVERHTGHRGVTALTLQWSQPVDGLGRATGLLYQVEQALVHHPEEGGTARKRRNKGTVTSAAGGGSETRGGRAGELAQLALEKSLPWKAIAIAERPLVRVEVPDSAVKCFYRVRCGKVHMRLDPSTNAVLSNVDDELGGVGYARGQVVMADRLPSNAPIVWSRWSQIGQIRTPEAPSAPLGLRVVQLGATAAKIRWMPPANAAAHGHLLYKVYVGVYEAVDSWVLAGATVGTSWVFPSLHPLSHYRVAVTVESSMGVSARNNVLHFSTRPVTQAEYVRPINSTVAHRPALSLNLRAEANARKEKSRRDSANPEAEGVQWLRRQSFVPPQVMGFGDGSDGRAALPGAVGGLLSASNGVADATGRGSSLGRPPPIRYEPPTAKDGRKSLPHLNAAARSVRGDVYV